MNGANAESKPIILDASGAVLGRLSSEAAKKIKNGEEVVIVNAEKARITGDPKRIKEKYLQRRRVGSPHHGPYYPIRPDLILRRAIRGMIPYKTNKGKDSM